MSTAAVARSPHRSPRHTALGRAVRTARAIRGLSQEELGFRAGLHRNYVGAIERGEINPTYRVLLKLEHGLGVPLSELIATSEALLRGSDSLSLAIRSSTPTSG
jgi:transcriptional regulator with XRE-family HTH domain